MRSRVLAFVLALGLLGLPAAPAAVAAELDVGTSVDAIVVVAESDLDALLESGLLGEHSFVTAEEVGLDLESLTGAFRFGEDTVLTPQELGLDSPEWPFIFGPRFAPFFAGFRTISVPVVVPRVVSVPVTVPVVAFRPVVVPPSVLLPPPPPVFRPFPLFRPFLPFRFRGSVIILRGF
jgi:hypothetical protein